jgi:DNA-binding winged helix-turn-helix (wHTH) protein/tetratricopeptide (TPR) repeat protein
MGDSESLRLRFDAFELDEADARLTRTGQPIALPPKAFAVLCTLARQPGQLVTKDALLDAVWGHRHVSESVLKTTISELRAALSDDAKQPRYIETASRRGYRFICALGAPPAASHAAATSEPALTAEPGEAVIIGRREVRARLRAAWNHAAAGRRQIVWIAGEAGVGKTTLIESAIAELGEIVCAHGQCVEQFGAGEPYLPMLEALGALCRQDAALVPMMRAVAPTWLLQLPWLSDEAERDSMRRELAGSSPDRMPRELGELLDRYTQQQPLLLVTEDLHWSDHATVRLIDHIARRRSPARLMWLASFRLAEVIAENHPLKGLRHELRLHRLCDEIVLDSFSEQEVADYIGSRVPGTAFSEAFVRSLHDHTDGLPLFVANVIDDLVLQGVVESGAAAPDAASAIWQVPENLAGVIEKQIARLPEDKRAILEAASVCGMEFRSQTIAEVLAQDAARVGEQCDELVRQQHWITHVDIGGLADGTLGARYVFRHALYRHVFYQRIGPMTRAQLHRKVADSMERGRAAGIGVTAAELASHYDLGHEPLTALRHYIDAADRALSQFAPVEAVNLTAAALALVPRCPENPNRLRLELELSLKRGVACSQLLGMSSPETTAAFERAQSICDLMPDTPALAWALGGLGLVRYGNGDYRAALALGERLQAIVKVHDDPPLKIAAFNLTGMSCAALGEYGNAQQWLRRGIEVCNQMEGPIPHDRFFVDPGVSMHGHLGLYLLPSALYDEARVHVEAGLARAQRLGHPMARSLATRSVCMLEIALERPEPVAALAAQLEKLAVEHAIGYAQGMGRLLGGWALAHMGDPDAGHAHIIEGHEVFKRLGVVSITTQILCYAADASIQGGHWSQAQAHIDEALQLAQRLGERLRVADLLLLQARVELGRGQVAAARTSMRASLDEARAREALGFELAALVALCEMDGASAADREALKDACARVKEGLDTKPVKKAKELAGLR